jgi:drug/metabolite transporter (DMT)-like permease
VRRVVRRVALGFEALVAAVVGTLALVLAMLYACIGDEGPRCQRGQPQQGIALVVVAALAFAVMVIAIRALWSASPRYDLLVGVAQVPVIAAIGFTVIFYRFNPTRPPMWLALLMALSVATVLPEKTHNARAQRRPRPSRTRP